MKHISQIIAEMTKDWKGNAGVETPPVDGAAIMAKMQADKELDFLDATRPKQYERRTRRMRTKSAKGYCKVCHEHLPAEEMATLCCVDLCHRHCPHPLPPTQTPRRTADTLIAHQMRSSWGIVHSNGKGKALDRAKSEIQRRRD